MEECQRSLNAVTTEQEVPVPKLCCFCVPHRLGLFVLASLKLVLNLVILFVILSTLFIIFIFSNIILFYPISALACFAIFVCLVDIFIGLLALVSICMKDQDMLEMYYKYTVYVFRSLTVLCIIIYILVGIYFFSPFATDILTRHIIGISILIGILFAILVILVVLNQMVKREVLILRSNEQFRI